MKATPGISVRRIVFWQPIESPHQRDFLEAVAADFPGEVVLAAERRLPVERVAQGWPAAVHEKVRVVDAADPVRYRELVAHDTADTLHVFSGFFSHRIVWRAFRRLASTPARKAMLSEAPEMAFPTAWLKRLRGRFLVRRFGDRFDVVMAMGGLGRRFLEEVGFPAARVLTLGYRLAVPAQPWPPAPPATDGPVRFVAAGQCIRRKGLDVLLDALATLPALGWVCDFYGDGPLRGWLERRLARLALADRVRFHPTVASDTLRREIARADWTVVPSRHDGWGMLVNESMIAGTPVVCSDGCGAADLVVGGDAGHIVPAGDPSALARVLTSCVAGGKIDIIRRRRVHAMAAENGVDEIVAAFLRRVHDLG